MRSKDTDRIQTGTDIDYVKWRYEYACAVDV
jgi:hypothetical protein